MLKIFVLGLLLPIVGNCQLLRDEERPTRYILPYSGLGGGEESEIAEEKHYYKPNRRSERIPATAYQYDEAEEEYYRPQPQPRQKVETENYKYQPSTSTRSHKDYEEILKHNHLARLRVAAKKQSQNQAQTQPQQPVEQYLKEVNPTTKTAFQRPSNYLRFSGQSTLKQDQNEETTLKQQSYRYILQPELQQQKSFQQYEFEAQQEPVKQAPKTTPFNLVAYQNALLARQKLLAAENQEEDQPKSNLYVPQSLKKTKKQKTTPSRQTAAQQYDYYPQVPPQRASYFSEAEVSRYQQPRNLYSKNENLRLEDSLLYSEKELEYPTQAPTRAAKQRTTTRSPRRKPKYQNEESDDDYQPSKYQSDDSLYDYQPSSKYSDEPTYRRPSPRPTKVPKYEEQSEAKDDYLYQPLPKYQRENIPRRQQPHYSSEPEVRSNRYLSRQQYPEETKQFPRYQVADLAYQPTAQVAVRDTGRGPSVSYRQTYPQYQYDRRHQPITRLQPKTRYFNSVDYQYEEVPSAYIINNPLYLTTQKMYPSTQYKSHTASQRKTNTIKLLPVSKKRNYEVDESVEDSEPEEAVYNYSVRKYQLPDNTPKSKFNPENVIKKKGLHYPRRTKKPTYLNGQFFREKVTPPGQYPVQDLTAQSSTNTAVKYGSTKPFLILVYDE